MTTGILRHQVPKNSTPSHSTRTLPPQVASEPTGERVPPSDCPLSPFQAVTSASDQVPDSDTSHRSRRSPILRPARLGSRAPSLRLHSFSRAAQGTQGNIYSLAHWFPGKSHDSGTARWKRHTGRGVGRGTDFHAIQGHSSRSPTWMLSGSPALWGLYGGLMTVMSE